MAASHPNRDGRSNLSKGPMDSVTRDGPGMGLAASQETIATMSADFASFRSSSPAVVIPAVQQQSFNPTTTSRCPSAIGDLVVMNPDPEASAPYRIVTRSPLELRPHPSLVKHNLGVSVARLSAIAARWNPSNLDPVSITRNGTVLKGHEVCALARRKELERVSCLEYDLDEAEALLWITQHSHQDQELKSYQRIVLALDYEPSFRERARKNQRVGGQFKGLTTLSEAQAINCRREIARLAGVSEGTLAKVRRRLEAGCPELLEALCEGEVSIDCAFGWLRNPEKQLDHLTLYRSLHGITRTIDSLLHRHRIAGPAGTGQLDISATRQCAGRYGYRAKDLRPRRYDQDFRQGHSAFRGAFASLGNTRGAAAVKHSESPLKKVFELTQDEWDRPAERAAVRDNFRKVCVCRTPALGGEVYASTAVEKVFYHTCKSKCCPSCGNCGTLRWLQEQRAALPDISFVGIVSSPCPMCSGRSSKLIGIYSTICQSSVRPCSSSGRGTCIKYACT